jgi:hypothetical protein
MAHHVGQWGLADSCDKKNKAVTVSGSIAIPFSP